MSALRLPTLLLAAAAAVPIAGCDIGDAAEPVPTDAGPVESRPFTAADFTGVVAATPDRIVIRQGDVFAVTARGNRALLDRLDIGVDGDSLRIRRKGQMSDADQTRLGTAVITITMPRLDGITLAGSGEVIADRLDGGNASLTLAGTGDMTIGNAAVTALDVTLAGAGDITMTGRAESADITVAGSGSVGGVTFGVRTADVTVAGSGDVTLQVSNSADVSVLGSGDVTITGGGACTTSRRGSGNVTCRE